MPTLKFHHPQTHLSAQELRDRVKLARTYVALTHTYRDLFFPNGKKMGDFETLLVLVCVFIADAEGASTSVTKLGAYSRLPRPTVYRRLAQLCKLGKIVKVGRSYYLAPSSVSRDDRGRIAKILRELTSK